MKTLPEISRMLVCVLALMPGHVTSATAPDYTFTTISGNSGHGSADGVGSAARFSSPLGIVVDASGNLFVADGYNHNLRKLSAAGTNWVVSTIAGRRAVQGSNDGTNTAARFNVPTGLGAHSNGNLFVADSYNSTIRMVSPSGTNWSVTTIAGQPEVSGSSDGTNSAALFSQSLGITVTAGGNIFVTEGSNHTIRRLIPEGTNWIVRTIAGLAETSGTNDGMNSDARFTGPVGIVEDATGNLYVTDSGNQTLRKLTPSGTNWIVSTIAGTAEAYGSDDGTNSTARFYAPSQIAMDGAGALFVADSGNYTIRKVTPVGTNWVVTTIAGLAGFSGSADGSNSTARFFQPFGIVARTNGDLFVTDSGNNTIRKLSASGTNWIVTTLAGLASGSDILDGTNFAARYASPRPGGVDAAGNVYIVDSESYTVQKLSRVGTDWVVQTIAGRARSSGSSNGTNSAARFFLPYAVTAETNGTLYVADTFNVTIRKIVPEGTNWIVTTIAGSTGQSGSDDGTNDLARFNYPYALTVDPNRNLFVADTFGNTIRKLTPDGTNWVVTTISGSLVSGSADGTNTSARFSSPQGIVAGNGGVVFVADTDNHTIRKLSPLGTNWVATTIAGSAGNPGATDGTNSAARFNGPAGIGADAAGNLFVAEYGSSTIRKLTPAGTNWVVTTIGGEAGVFGNLDGTGTNALFGGPGSLVVDSSGRLFIGDNRTIRLGEQPGLNALLPLLGILRSGNQVILTWPGSAAGFQLETTTNLAPANWNSLTGAVLISNQFSLTNPINLPAAFFRLHQQ